MLGIVVVSSLAVGIYARTRNRAPSLDTPAPVDLSQDYTGDLNDLENIPSLQEAKGYLEMVRVKRTLTNTEFERLIVLTGYTKHPLTVMFSTTAVRVALEAMGNPEPFRSKFLDTVVGNLRCPDSTVRQTAISTIGNTNAKDRSEAIIPFLKSADPKERNAAKMALTKLGYKFPPDPKPTE